MGKALTLTFSATKRPNTRVYCAGVRFKFEVDKSGTKTEALTCNEGGIGQKTTPDNIWDFLSASGGAFRFAPRGSSDEVKEGCTFELRDIVVSSVLGSATVTVTEHSADHDKAQCHEADHSACYQDRVATFTVPKFPQNFNFDEGEFKTDKTIVEPGGSVTVWWRGDTEGLYQLYVNDAPVDDKAIQMTNQSAGTARWSYSTLGLNHATALKLSVSYRSTGVEVTREYVRGVIVNKEEISLGVKGATTLSIRAGQEILLRWDPTNATPAEIKITGQADPVHTVTNTNEQEWKDSPPETTTYYVTGKGRSGRLITSNEVEIDVVPQMPAVKADLALIRTPDTGKIGVCVSDGARGFQQTWFTGTSGFDAAEGASGRWQLSQYVERGDLERAQREHPQGAAPVTLDYPPALVFIKTRPAGPLVEIGSALAITWKPDGPFHTSFPKSLGPAGTWQVFPLNQSHPDLVFIQTANTDYVQVHTTRYLKAFCDRPAKWDTCYKATSPLLGRYLMADMGSHGRPADHVFIQTANTAHKRVELSWATAASNYKELVGPLKTDFRIENADKGTWQLADMDGDGRPDLVFVKTAATVSGRIEVYYALAKHDYRRPSNEDSLLGGYTMFDVAEGARGTWQVVPFPLERPAGR
jgi:hypothetical protein